MPKDHETGENTRTASGPRHARVTSGQTMDPVDTIQLSVVADICRRAAGDLARAGYKPDGEKVLRRFGLAEICRYMLPLPPAELRALLRANHDWPQGHGEAGQLAFSLEEVNRLRTLLTPMHPACHARVTRPDGAQAKVVSLCNFKGGVSKTTTAAHLAMAAALGGLSVLVVDLDSQASMSGLFGVAPESEAGTAYAALAWDRARHAPAAHPLPSGDPAADYADITADDLVVPTHWPTIDILPAQLNLYWAEFQVPVWLQGARGWRFWDALGNFLTAEGLKDDYDLIIVDTPPALGYLTINALAASDILLVPVGASFIEFDSTGRFFDMLATTFASVEETLAATHPDPPRFTWDAVQVILTRHDEAQQGELADLIQTYLGDTVSPYRQTATALIGQAGERVSGLYEAAPSDFNAQTYHRGRASFDQGWAMLADLLTVSWAEGTDTEDRA